MTICNDINCNKQAIYGYKYKESLKCSKHRVKDMSNTANKRCEYPNCLKTLPLFNLPNELNGKFCAEHKTKEMINVKTKKCIKCNIKQPIFGLEEDSKATHCGDCKTNIMIDVKNQKCIKCNIKQPIFGLEEDSKATYCGDCKTNIMIDVKNKKCIECNIKRPTFGLEKDKATHCADCKTDIMTDVLNQKCIKCNIKQPIFGLEEDSTATHCGDCKTNIMIDVKNKKCIECNIKRPTFGLEKDKATHCFDCKTDIMTDVLNRKCIECNIKIGNFALEGDKASYCYNCKSSEMVNVIDKKCNSNYLEDGKAFPCPTLANPKYNGFCTHCFTNLFPNDPLIKQICKKTKEIAVRDFINSNFEGFQHDIPLWTGDCDCSHKRRIDHRKLIGNTLLCIETDENSHKYYDKNDEEIRYDDLMMLHGGKFIFIRFNPDKYIEYGQKKNPQMKTRLDTLQKEIEKQIKRIEKNKNTELLEIIHMYYNKI
jgi:uncharacterized protein YajQ (UPF0234 family)